MLPARLLRAVGFAVLFAATVAVSPARASGFTLGDAATYAVLYEGVGGHNLQITNVSINGNIGVGGTGKVQDNGPSTINGRLDFSAANTGQFHNNNGANVGPTTVNYGQANVSTALTQVNSLSTTLGGEAGSNLSINGNQTIDITAGTLDASGDFVFDITSYHENDGNLLTIKGDGVHSVVFNFAAGLNLGGDVVLLGGLMSDQVLWNFVGAGNVQLNNNASSFPNLAFQGIILAPNNAISLVNANLNGRVFGGNSSDMQIVSGDTINQPVRIQVPTPVPEPATLLLVGAGLIAATRRRNLPRR